jgi:Asp-tRNA(Asn)/Glu-tRNA(Gln) amidotransferase A subunit family amidase
LRIGLLTTFYEGDAVHPEVCAAIEAFAAELQGLGHHVEPVRWTSARTMSCTR